MDEKQHSRASDEVPFLADEESEDFVPSKRQSRLVRWAHLLPYSGLLNVALLVILFTTWIAQSQSLKKAYIPNEIYCEFFDYV